MKFLHVHLWFTIILKCRCASVEENLYAHFKSNAIEENIFETNSQSLHN